MYILILEMNTASNLVFKLYFDITLSVQDQCPVIKWAFNSKFCNQWLDQFTASNATLESLRNRYGQS